MDIIATTSEDQFACDKCGLCCKNIGGIDELTSMNRGDGTCKHFNDISLECSIYDQRPLICRVDEGYVLFEKEYTKEEYYKLNIKSCTTLKDLNIGSI
jgi:Fe-S-cluster containining protein